MENHVSTPVINNFFSYSHHPRTEEIFDTLLSTDSVKIERILSQGQHTSEGIWLEQDFHEWVMLVKGAARLSFKDSSELFEMKPGDYLLIPANTPHRVEWTDPNKESLWLAVHLKKEC